MVSMWDYGSCSDGMQRCSLTSIEQNLEKLRQIEKYLGSKFPICYVEQTNFSKGVGKMEVDKVITTLEHQIAIEKRKNEIEAIIEKETGIIFTAADKTVYRSNFTSTNKVMTKIHRLVAKREFVDNEKLQGEYQRLLNESHYHFVIGVDDPRKLLTEDERLSMKGAEALAEGDTTYLQRRRNLVEAGMDWDEATRTAEREDKKP